jgi:hypothetical protein
MTTMSSIELKQSLGDLCSVPSDAMIQLAFERNPLRLNVLGEKFRNTSSRSRSSSKISLASTELFWLRTGMEAVDLSFMSGVVLKASPMVKEY